MLKLIQTVSLAGLVAVSAAPVYAWWWEQNNGDWQSSDGYDRQRHITSREGWKPWKDGVWQNWRAPWSNDGSSRWGTGPWNSFGESFGDMMGEVEVDTNVRVKGKTSGSGENGSKTWNYGYSNSYRGYPPPHIYWPAPYPYYGPYGPYPYYRPQVAPYAPYPPRY